ncbi:MAG TPA: PIN domain-containing protein [Candidatus Limnocylindria bacterium]|nr:PIN domain-containing protein [Candidatus Limnocylindria bacterium]
MTVFVDTSAIFAFLAANDVDHDRAAATLADLRQNEELVTHNYVVVETAALVHSRLGPEAARDLLRVFLPSLNVSWVDERLHEAATSGYLAARRRDISLVDWVSFEFMHRSGLTDAFAFDRDFAEQGFALIPLAR